MKIEALYVVNHIGNDWLYNRTVLYVHKLFKVFVTFHEQRGEDLETYDH